MKIKIDKKEILKNLGIECISDFDYILYMKKLAEKLESHNKNYTKEQYFEILNILEILKNIEEE